VFSFIADFNALLLIVGLMDYCKMLSSLSH